MDAAPGSTHASPAALAMAAGAWPPPRLPQVASMQEKTPHRPRSPCSAAEHIFPTADHLSKYQYQSIIAITHCVESPLFLR